MPQGSVNGPKVVQYIHQWPLIPFLSTEACHIADDTTPFVCDLDLGIVIQNLGSNVASALMWFDTNYEIQPEYVTSLCQQFRQNCFG